MEKGKMTLVCGTYASGKTGMLLNRMVDLALNGKKCLFVSFERENISERIKRISEQHIAGKHIADGNSGIYDFNVDVANTLPDIKIIEQYDAVFLDGISILSANEEEEISKNLWSMSRKNGAQVFVSLHISKTQFAGLCDPHVSRIIKFFDERIIL